MKIREAALRRALTKVDVHEEPPFSNRGRQIDEWNTCAGAPLGSPYCCSFVHTMFYRATGFVLGGGASVQAMRQWAMANGFMVARPRRADLACFDFGTGRYGPYGDHTGFVVRVLALRWTGGKFTGWIRTVEANTSAQADMNGSQADGGGVYIRTRWLRGIGAEFVRVPGDKK